MMSFVYNRIILHADRVFVLFQRHVSTVFLPFSESKSMEVTLLAATAANASYWEGTFSKACS